MANHAKLSPSSADRWSKCTASIAMEEGLPDIISPYAEEGTRAHELLEKSIRTCTPPMKVEFDFGEYDEQEMRKNVQIAYDYIAKGIDNPNVIIFSEVKVVFRDDCWGTVDIVKIDGSDLEIIDLKYG